MRFLALLHTPSEHPGLIRQWVQSKGWDLDEVLWPISPVPPNPEDYQGFFIMGGPMGVYETATNPWILDELDFLKHLIRNRKPILGICLGSQLLAAALGAEVFPSGLREIGWFPVFLTTNAQRLLNFEQAELLVLHWHGDTFQLPPGCEPLGRSQPGILQGFFKPPNVAAFQFHLEVDEQLLADFISGDEAYIMEGLEKYPETVQTPTQIATLGVKHIPTCRSLLFKFLDEWMVKSSSLSI